MGPLGKEIREILGSGGLPALVEVRDGQRSIAEADGTEAVMEKLMVIEKAIERLADAIDDAARR